MTSNQPILLLTARSSDEALLVEIRTMLSEHGEEVGPVSHEPNASLRMDPSFGHELAFKLFAALTVDAVLHLIVWIRNRWKRAGQTESAANPEMSIQVEDVTILIRESLSEEEIQKLTEAVQKVRASQDYSDGKSIQR